MTDRIVGERTTTVVSDSYGQTVITGPPTPTENPNRWNPPTLATPAVCRRYDVTAEELVEWQAKYHFPKPKKSSRQITSGWDTTLVQEWAPEALSAWDAEIRAIAAKLPRK